MFSVHDDPGMQHCPGNGAERKRLNMDYEMCEAYKIKGTVGICRGTDCESCDNCPAYIRYKEKVIEEYEQHKRELYRMKS